VEGYFYNPNIAPFAEYKLRRKAVVEMARRMNLKIHYRDERLFKKFPSPHRGACPPKPKAKGEGKGEGDKRSGEEIKLSMPCSQPALVVAKPQRCANCWWMRLSETAKAAKQAGVDAFSTTLLISPYQNHKEIRIIGSELEREVKVNFYYDDFRPGFRRSQQMAKEQGLYRQKYCGCEFSIEEAQTPITRGQV
jgi:predicted adenine nucleotide alpha hydrolase (AANH) superfamily ATPase